MPRLIADHAETTTRESAVDHAAPLYLRAAELLIGYAPACRRQAARQNHPIAAMNPNAAVLPLMASDINDATAFRTKLEAQPDRDLVS